MEGQVLKLEALLQGHRCRRSGRRRSTLPALAVLRADHAPRGAFGRLGGDAGEPEGGGRPPPRAPALGCEGHRGPPRLPRGRRQRGARAAALEPHGLAGPPRAAPAPQRHALRPRRQSLGENGQCPVASAVAGALGLPDGHRQGRAPEAQRGQSCQPTLWHSHREVGQSLLDSCQPHLGFQDTPNLALRARHVEVTHCTGAALAGGHAVARLHPVLRGSVHALRLLVGLARQRRHDLAVEDRAEGPPEGRAAEEKGRVLGGRWQVAGTLHG
mmetsp:Transcript_142013/g.360636  ORF Transcript_142013/g.360636 Transcript_142013/m.360636 type:complete len:271 (-) Transcript_142013:12-824(-)